MASVASRLICVFSIFASPSHNAITERSTPACRRSMAMVCLKRWTVTRLCFNEGQRLEAVTRCLLSGTCEKLDQGPRKTLAGDGQHPLDLSGMSRRLECCETKERAQSSQ